MDSSKINSIILLCGPPASGKDSITEAICKIDEGFYHFKKHRAINGKTYMHRNNYIDITKDEFKKMIENDEFIQYHERYNRYYGISKKAMADGISKNLNMIIHTGRIENLQELKKKINENTISILLWAPMDILRQRLVKRHHNNENEISRRLIAAQEEFIDLTKIDLKKSFDAIIKTTDPQKDIALKLIKYINDKEVPHYEVFGLETYIQKFK